VVSVLPLVPNSQTLSAMCRKFSSKMRAIICPAVCACLGETLCAVAGNGDGDGDGDGDGGVWGMAGSVQRVVR
jgi:hypothetical protein